jgi:hypothetical protein
MRANKACFFLLTKDLTNEIFFHELCIQIEKMHMCMTQNKALTEYH